MFFKKLFKGKFGKGKRFSSNDSKDLTSKSEKVIESDQFIYTVYNYDGDDWIVVDIMPSQEVQILVSEPQPEPMPCGSRHCESSVFYQSPHSSQNLLDKSAISYKSIGIENIPPDLMVLISSESSCDVDPVIFSKVVLGMKCNQQLKYEHNQMLEKSFRDNISTAQYFGLSDSDDIIIRFNIKEHKPLEGVRRFTNGIDFHGRKRSAKSPIPVGIEVKEVENGILDRFINVLCSSFRALFCFSAPPRLQALRGRKNGSGSGGNTPGEGVRAYALHLAADKTTTFAQNVDNFIACTKDSKETCPHVVMRNMRQFMSGMKNYLVKHGEREFEKEVEKERLKLKANEFLNLDTILEGVLNGAVITPLRSHVYNLLADKFAKGGDVGLLTNGMKAARQLPPLCLGIRPSVRIPSDSELVIISQHFVKMQEADSPSDKLEHLLASISAIFNSMKQGVGAPIGADDFLPVLVLTLAKCSVVGAELEAEVMASLLPPPILAGEGGYYLTTLFGAVTVLKKLGSTEQDKSFDWRTGSFGSASCVAGVNTVGAGVVTRILIPDETTGALRRVALPWRPGARVRDLCRALAHRVRNTNPQDYGLFALHDGEETLLSDADLSQDIIIDGKYANCMLAYKRIDAKIAWPKQAFICST